MNPKTTNIMRRTQMQLVVNGIRYRLQNALSYDKAAIKEARELLGQTQNSSDGSADQGLWYQTREIVHAYDNLVAALRDNQAAALAKAEAKRQRGEPVEW